MDSNRLTGKAPDAIRQAQRHGQSQIEAEHLALALPRAARPQLNGG